MEELPRHSLSEAESGVFAGTGRSSGCVGLGVLNPKFLGRGGTEIGPLACPKLLSGNDPHEDAVKIPDVRLHLN